MNTSLKTLIFWLLMVVSAVLFWQVVRVNPSSARTPEISYSTFISQAESGQIARVTITGSRIEGEYRDGKGRFRLTGPNDPAVFLGVLHDKSVEILFREVGEQNLPLQLLGSWAPLILLGALWFFMVRQMQLRRNPAGGVQSNADQPGGFR
jgi:cell division protease FtsH